MKRSWTRLLDLRSLILFFILSVIATLCISLIVAYRVQRDALIHSALEATGAYAAKVASSVGAVVQSAQGRLQYSSDVRAEDWNNPVTLRMEATTASQLTAPETSSALLRVNAWYRDAAAILQAMLTGFSYCNKDSGDTPMKLSTIPSQSSRIGDP